MERDDSVYLRHILDAISRIEEYLHGIDEEMFYQHHLVQDGVIGNLRSLVKPASGYRVKYEQCARTFHGRT